MKIIKPILLVVAVIVVTAIAYLIYRELMIERQNYYQGDPSLHFDTVKSTAINPATLLDDIRGGKKLVLQVQKDTPDNPPFIMPIGWSQNDFLEVAQAYQQVIWQDDPYLWHLYGVEFHTTCDNASGKFGMAEFYYYQAITKGGENLYSVRAIEIEPEYGYLAWYEDGIISRSRFGTLTEINMENITKIPAEKALPLADQRGGNDYRKKENNICNISVFMTPERSDWSVIYSGKTSLQFWIPTK